MTPEWWSSVITILLVMVAILGGFFAGYNWRKFND